MNPMSPASQTYAVTSLMRRFPAIVAAATLLLHAVVGCCWHHQHVEVVAGSEEVQFLPVACGGHVHADHDHEHGDAPAGPGDHRHLPDECGEGSCRFVRGEAPAYPSPFDGLTATIADSPQLFVIGYWQQRSHDRGSRHILAGIPLHLRHQVLVI